MASREKVRILHLTASEFIGGPEKQILYHAADLNSPECEMIVGSFRNGKKTPDVVRRAQEMGLRTLELPPGRFDFRTVSALSKFLRDENVTLLCTHTYKANVTGYIAAPLAHCPQIGFVRGWLAENWKVRQYEKLDRFVLARMNWVACVSKPQADFLKSRRGNKREPFVVPNAALLLAQPDPSMARKPELRRTLSLPEESFLIGAIGRFSIEKGHRYLLESMKTIVSQRPKAHLVLLGEGRERKNLEDLAEQLGIRPFITFADFQKNVSPWIRACDVIVNPSLTEGIPNVVLEAMALRTPVIATSVGGVPDLIQDGKSGRLVPSQDGGALAAAILALLENPIRSAEMASHAFEKVTQDFSPLRQRLHLVAMYEEVLRRKLLTSKGNPSEASKDCGFEIPADGVSRVEPSHVPFMSVVIPVRNEEICLGGVLERLTAQNYPNDRLEILVADGNSTDRTAEVVESWARKSNVRIKAVPNPAQLSSAGRNAGVHNARGDVILFVDGHCEIPDDNLLKNVADLLQKTGADCLCRPQPLTTKDNDTFQNAVAHVRATTLGHGRDSTIYEQKWEGEVNPSSAGAIYRREVFDKVGYYDESFDACEDVEFNHRVFRAGLKSILSPRLKVYYHPRKTLIGLWRQMIRYGRGRARLSRKHADALSIPQALPAAFLVWVIGGGVLGVSFHPLAIVYIASLVLYLGVVLAYSSKIGFQESWKEAIWAPLLYFTIHFGLGCGFLAEIISTPRAPAGGKSHTPVVLPE